MSPELVIYIILLSVIRFCRGLFLDQLHHNVSLCACFTQMCHLKIFIEILIDLFKFSSTF